MHRAIVTSLVLVLWLVLSGCGKSKQVMPSEKADEPGRQVSWGISYHHWNSWGGDWLNWRAGANGPTPEGTIQHSMLPVSFNGARVKSTPTAFSRAFYEQAPNNYGDDVLLTDTHGKFIKVWSKLGPPASMSTAHVSGGFAVGGSCESSVAGMIFPEPLPSGSRPNSFIYQVPYNGNTAIVRHTPTTGVTTYDWDITTNPPQILQVPGLPTSYGSPIKAEPDTYYDYCYFPTTAGLWIYNPWNYLTIIPPSPVPAGAGVITDIMAPAAGAWNPLNGLPMYGTGLDRSFGSITCWSLSGGPYCNPLPLTGTVPGVGLPQGNITLLDGLGYFFNAHMVAPTRDQILYMRQVPSGQTSPPLTEFLGVETVLGSVRENERYRSSGTVGVNYPGRLYNYAVVKELANGQGVLQLFSFFPNTSLNLNDWGDPTITQVIVSTSPSFPNPSDFAPATDTSNSIIWVPCEDRMRAFEMTYTPGSPPGPPVLTEIFVSDPLGTVASSVSIGGSAQQFPTLPSNRVYVVYDQEVGHGVTSMLHAFYNN